MSENSNNGHVLRLTIHHNIVQHCDLGVVKRLTITLLQIYYGVCFKIFKS